MDQTKLRRRKILRSAVLVLANLMIIVCMVLLCYQYTRASHAKTRRTELDAFAATVSSMERMAFNYLRNQQEVCNNWAQYLADHPMSVEDAVAYLKSVNSNSDVMAHIIDMDTYAGYATVTDKNGSNSVNYSRITGFSLGLTDAIDDPDFSVNISNMYTNPLNGMSVVSFARPVTLLDKNGQPDEYQLLRVVPISLLQANWSFPAAYKDAELSLIKSGGDYIVRSESLKNANFWEYMRIYNGLDYHQASDLAAFLLASTDTYTGKDASGQTAYYVCLSAAGDDDWRFIGYLPAASLSAAPTDWTMLVYVVIGALALFVIDGGFILHINRRLKQSVEETRLANTAKTRFLSSMSHDIRTPMNAIVGMTAIAEKHLDNPEQVRSCLSKITMASNHLLMLINDVLDISKVESGKMTLSPMVFSLPESVANLANIVRSNVRAKSLDFDIHVYSVPYENLFADELRIDQIFINILSNAVKYTGEGGRITMSVEERLLPDDPKRVALVYKVADTGIGMSEEFQKTMYQAFTRAVDTRIDTIQGSGLGLAITKQMVDMMDGTIECESALGKGTTFTVTLPVPIAEKAPEELALPPMNVLLVDDDPIFLETAKDTLESLGLTVDTAGSGKDAVRMVAQRHEEGRGYPAVIVDWMMPGMDGVETSRRIREAVGSETPIIIISAYDRSDMEDAAFEAGANAFLNKPIFRSTVYAAINEILYAGGNGKEEASDVPTDMAGLRLLVAEDNDMNWEIIEELLQFSGISCERAVNGEVCVDMVSRAASGAYDAIIMDIQMPVMNGYDATRAIRRLGVAEKRDIPIIAMTADAFSEDVRACMDAGMNGHVAKPVDLNKLFAEFHRVGLTPRTKKEASL